MSMNQLNPTASAVASQVGGSGTGNDQQVADVITALDPDNCKARWTRSASANQIGTVDNGQTWYCYGYGEPDIGTVIESVTLSPDAATNDTSGDTITASVHIMELGSGSPESGVRLTPEIAFSARSSEVPNLANGETPYIVPCGNAYIAPGATWGLKLVANTGTAEWTNVSIVVAYRHQHVGV